MGEISVKTGNNARNGGKNSLNRLIRLFAGKKSAQIREILISESAWEEMTCLFAPSLNDVSLTYKGGRAAFCFIIDSGVTWWGMYSLFDRDEKINFKKGKLFVTTDLNTYEFKLPKHYLTALEGAYSQYQAIK
ncbi:TPA: hypothetical protein MEW43_004689 [Klebsiella pneumoniae]|nr:hypothetical protein [Klebsiella pneumoniae]